MGLRNASASNRAIILAALAIVSAILSNFAGHGGILWSPRLAVWGIPLLAVWGIPLLPGVFFGAVLALAIWLWVSRRILAIAAILLSTVLAWLAAYFTAEYVFFSIQKMLDEIAAPGKIFPTINFTFAVCGVLGGLVGSATLTFALSLICKEFGAFENWARIVMPGTALGVLLELSAKDDKLPVHIGSILPLFLAWQVTVAAIIGYCIVPRSGDGKLAPH
jgi:hypothetical protein